MTPVASWSPADYYRASRAARRACERSAEQLQIDAVLEEAEPARTSASSSAPSEGSAAGTPPLWAGTGSGALGPSTRKDTP